jgi:drug/metabolite transporter (DMT)-like permease
VVKPDRVYVALFVSLTLWASSFPGIKASLDGYSPVGLAAVRFLIASLALASIAPWVKVRRPRKSDLPLIGVLAFVGVADEVWPAHIGAALHMLAFSIVNEAILPQVPKPPRAFPQVVAFADTEDRPG